MSNLKRIVSSILCAAALFASMQTASAKEDVVPVISSFQTSVSTVADSVPCNAMDYYETNVSNEKRTNEAVIDKYLLSVGFSEEFIEFNDYNKKYELYKDRAVAGPSEVTYGVMTDDYSVFYTLKIDGSVIISPEELKTFNKLLDDDNAVRRILRYNEKTEENLRLAKLCETKAGLAELHKLPVETQLKALTNWYAECFVSHISFSNRVAKKKLFYNWRWNYCPVWRLTDKVAVAWGAGFIADAHPYGEYRLYETVIGGVEKETHRAYMFDYAEYNIGCGAAQDVDIVSAASGSPTVRHQGTFQVNLTLDPAQHALTAAKGCYFHTKITPAITLNFTSAPSIGVSGASFLYDKSAETVTTFYTTNGNKPKAPHVVMLPPRNKDE